MEKAVIVTGAGGFIGSAVALAFGAAGDKVMLTDLNPARLPELAGTINRGPGQAIFSTADVREYREIKRVVDETLQKWQRLDVMAAVAGGGYARLSGKKDKPLLDYTDEDWDLVVDTNLKGVFESIRASAPVLVGQKHGHIIIMGSGTGLKGEAKRALYAAAKSGVNGLMKAAARELGEHNVQINVVNPGRTLRPGDADEKGVFADESRLVQENVLRRIHHDASQTASFFVHLSRMNDVSGQIFNLDSRILM
ncbi:MAG: SDR family oxidoreductase [Chloroflexi bacterium]|nr:SDR family oxidoreductase [Chloroflexota bacterium]